jgi:DNA-binding ferritin-like protein
MHETRNDLPAASRAKVIAALNARLADAVDLGAQAKHAHWNVKGPNFIARHELFDKLRALKNMLTNSPSVLRLWAARPMALLALLRVRRA